MSSKKKYQSSMATYDHIIPKSHGGLITFKNGVCACSSAVFFSQSSEIPVNEALESPFLFLNSLETQKRDASAR